MQPPKQSNATRLDLPVWKKSLYAVAVLFVVALISELTLTVCGITPVSYREDPYVGFASYFPLFVNQTDSDDTAVMETAKNKLEFFGMQRFTTKKPSPTYRIFCVGGSTTYGRPYTDITSFCGWLRAFLPEADSSRKWEVINAGGISYASYRVALLMEELIEYEPDMFIVYSGHNEFLERRTYDRIIRTPKTLRGLGSILGKTRTYAGLRRLAHLVAPTPQRSGGQDALPSEVVTILEKSVGPEAYHRNDELSQTILTHYRFNLTRMVEIARSVGAQIVFVTPASNLKDCSPFKSENRSDLSDGQRQQWQKAYGQAEDAYRDQQWNLVEQEIDKAILLDDRFAHAHYLRGRALWELDRHRDANEAFRRARDEDVCPLRALSPMYDIVMDVASEQRVDVVDFVALAEQQSPHGTPGDELFLDHVHPTIEGNRQLALGLLDKLKDLQIVRTGGEWNDEKIESIQQHVLSKLDRSAHGRALRNLSRLYRWAGKNEEANKLALQALELAPDDAEAHFQAGANAVDSRQWDEAIKHLTDSLQLDKENVDAHNRLGIALVAKEQHAQAIQHYLEALRLDPDSAEVHHNVGKAFSAVGDTAKAIDHYRESLSIRADGRGIDRVHNNLAIALTKFGQLDEAIHHCRKALEFNPGHPDTYNNLANALKARGQLDKAIVEYRQALRLNPDLVEAHYNLGGVLLSLRKWEESKTHLKEAIRLQPDHARAYNNLGIVSASQGQLDEAIKYYQEAIRHDANYAKAHENLGVSLLSKGLINKAVPRFRQVVALRPDDHMAWLRLGEVLRMQGLPEEAIDCLQRAAQLGPNDANAHGLLGVALARTNENENAILHLRKAIQLKPESPSYLRTLAWLLATHPDEGVRNPSDAVKLAEQAAALTKNRNPRVLDTLAAAYAAGGEFKRAIVTAEKAIELAAEVGADGVTLRIAERLELYRKQTPYLEQSERK